jgi:hypothetical protein
MWQFLEREANELPFMTGTYLGEKLIFNLGLGGYFQPGVEPR